MSAVWLFCTWRAAWISSLSTTSTPRSHAAGLAATRIAASTFAGPSAPAAAAPRIAPVTTTGLGPARRQIEQERRLLDRVGALDDHRAGDVAREPLAQVSRHGKDVVERQRWAGLAQGRMRLRSRPLRQVGRGAHEVLGRERRDDPAPDRRRHGDRAAERNEKNARKRHGTCTGDDIRSGEPVDRAGLPTPRVAV